MLLDWYLILHWDYIDKFKSILNLDLHNYSVLGNKLRLRKAGILLIWKWMLSLLTQPVGFAFAGIDGLFDGKYSKNMFMQPILRGKNINYQ